MNLQYFKDNMNVQLKIALTGLIVILISLTVFLINSPGKRAIFIFESMDSNRLYSEHRYIPNDTLQGELQYYVDELLLGPISNRYKPLFAHGTKTLSCFLTEDNILYIHLNEKALFQGNSSSETLKACELLKKNVLKNHKYVDSIRVFIMGNLVS